MVFYGAKTDLGSSGAPVMRVIDQKYRVVAIHRGQNMLNFGSLLSEIIYHVQHCEINPGKYAPNKPTNPYFTEINKHVYLHGIAESNYHQSTILFNLVNYQMNQIRDLWVYFMQHDHILFQLFHWFFGDP